MTKFESQLHHLVAFQSPCSVFSPVHWRAFFSDAERSSQNRDTCSAPLLPAAHHLPWPPWSRVSLLSRGQPLRLGRDHSNPEGETPEKTVLDPRKSTTNYNDGVASFVVNIPSDVTVLEFHVKTDDPEEFRRIHKNIRPATTIKQWPTKSRSQSLLSLSWTDSYKSLLMGEHLSVTVTLKSPSVDAITHYNYLVLRSFGKSDQDCGTGGGRSSAEVFYLAGLPVLTNANADDSQQDDGSFKKILRSRRDLKEEIENPGAPMSPVVFRSYDGIAQGLLHFVILAG
ncbi:complement C5-like [Equus caballus]|uniref:complement C5-like n=1 Tax=Equus caballus TaxID=9796 RepID=UPI0038B28E55